MEHKIWTSMLDGWSWNIFRKMEIDFLKSNFMFNYIFIVLLNPLLLFFLPGAGLGFAMGKIIFSRSNCRRPKKSKDIILFAPSILMIEKLCDSAHVDVSYNQWSGPCCVITRPSILFEIRFLLEKASLENSKVMMLWF